MSTFEQAVLGAMMLDSSAYWQVADVLSSADFQGERHAAIFDAIAGMAKAGKPVDAVTMGDELPEHFSYMLELAGSTPSAATIKHYAEEVRKASEMRRVKRVGQQIATINCSYADAQRMLADVAPRDSSAVKPVKAYMGDALALMQKRCEAQEVVTGLPTGLDQLDELTAGLQPGTLIFLAARPSMGKTALALQIAVRNALRKKRVMVFEMEMTGVQLSERSVSLISGVQFNFIKKPKLIPDEGWPRIVNAYAMLEESSLIIDESGAQTIESICARARQQHMQSPLSLIVVDHLGLMDLPGKGNPVNEIGIVTKQLKAMAKQLGIPVLCLVQLNRSVEQRADKRPMLSDLRDSGRIEEDADVVFMLYRDEYYNPGSPHKGFAELLVRKNRDGETDMIPLRARLDVMKFETCEALPHGTAKQSSSTVVDFGEYASGKSAAAGDHEQE